MANPHQDKTETISGNGTGINVKEKGGIKLYIYILIQNISIRKYTNTSSKAGVITPTCGYKNLLCPRGQTNAMACQYTGENLNGRKGPEKRRNKHDPRQNRFTAMLDNATMSGCLKSDSATSA